LDIPFLLGCALNAETKKSVYGPGWFACWILILMAVLLAPFYFWQCTSAVGRVWHSPFVAWLPVLREVAADILKLAIMLKFGFYFRNQAERRASLKLRRSDALHITVLCGLLSAALLPWYAFVLTIVLMLFIYAWEIRDINTDEKAHAFDTNFGTQMYPKKSS
jgi:hypothetical protein